MFVISSNGIFFPGWHVKSGHQSSVSYNRFLFDLDLLTKDLEEEGDKPEGHTLYYLGITHFALIEAGVPDVRNNYNIYHKIR